MDDTIKTTATRQAVDCRTYGACRQCNKPLNRVGVTCGNSFCQEQESKDNAARAASKGRRKAVRA